MKKNKGFVTRVLALLALSSLLLVFAFGESAAKNNVAAPSPAVQSTESAVDTARRGTLFRVRHAGSTAYLFGTIHVGDASFYPLGTPVAQAFAAADTLAVEFDVRDKEAVSRAMQKYALYPDGDMLERHLAPETLQRLKKVLQDIGIPYAGVARMRPWMVANLLIAVTLERGGFETRQGVDLHLLEQASMQGKTIKGLESADYQMSLFDTMSEKEQEKYLLENLDDIASGKLLEQSRALAVAWGKADDATFTALSDEELNEATTSADFMRRVMLDQRNPGMADGIAALMKPKGTIFVGVGMLHLIGEQGLPVLLRKRGYTVEKLY